MRRSFFFFFFFFFKKKNEQGLSHNLIRYRVVGVMLQLGAILLVLELMLALRLPGC
jgi:hypothetical protein